MQEGISLSHPIPQGSRRYGIGSFTELFYGGQEPCHWFNSVERMPNLLGGGLEEDKHLPCIVGKNLFCAQIECVCSPNFDF